jgi:hypothetical protein
MSWRAWAGLKAEFDDMAAEGLCVFGRHVHGGSLLGVFVVGVGLCLFGGILGIEPLVFDVVVEGFAFHSALEFAFHGGVWASVVPGELADGALCVAASIDVVIPEALEYHALFFGEVLFGRVVESESSFHGGVLVPGWLGNLRYKGNAPFFHARPRGGAPRGAPPRGRARAPFRGRFG